MRNYVHKGVTCFITKTAPDPAHVTGVGCSEHFWRAVAFNIFTFLKLVTISLSLSFLKSQACMDKFSITLKKQMFEPDISNL